MMSNFFLKSFVFQKMLILVVFYFVSEFCHKIFRISDGRYACLIRFNI